MLPFCFLLADLGMTVNYKPHRTILIKFLHHAHDISLTPMQKVLDTLLLMAPHFPVWDQPDLSSLTHLVLITAVYEDPYFFPITIRFLKIHYD